jgi:N-acyl homoserine lactone hydrolase
MKLYLLELGRIRSGEPILGYLLRTEDGKIVLIDTGYRPGTLGEEMGGDPSVLQATPEQLIVPQLRRLGLLPEVVSHVIVTHLDPDHAGFTGSFRNAEVVIQRKHLARARTSDAPRFQLTRPAWGNAELRFREVDGDTEILPGVHLLETSGHVTGHQSVLVHLPRTGAVLLPIDAMAREHLVAAETRVAGPFDEDEQELRKSTQKLTDVATRERALIIFAHDAQQWPTLRHFPDYYD